MGDQGEHTASQCQQDWIEAQNLLKMRLLVEDHFDWCMPTRESTKEDKSLRYIGGVDLSFSKEDPALACAALVVLDANTMDVVHEEFEIVRLRIPYVPGFLAFRELLMVDGNGLLHPRGFGLACHLGVLADIPTIGIGKNLHQVDGLTQYGVKQILEARENDKQDLFSLTGKSGQVWGVAMRSSGSSKPVYISIGHRISLDSSIEIVKLCSKYRVPEPVRQIFPYHWKGNAAGIDFLHTT